MEACHANGTRTDNRVSNLRWDTRKGNMADASAQGRTNRGEQNPWCKLTEKDVRAIRLSEQSNSQLAARYGMSREAIRDIRARKRWAHVQ
jgi:hypothetical protein